MVAALRFISKHADQPLRVDAVAKAVGCSRRMLEMRFRAAVGRSLNDEVQRSVHLEAAKRLLAETDWPIGKIAAESGYNSGSYLNVLFQRFLGMNAAEYRRRVHIEIAAPGWKGQRCKIVLATPPFPASGSSPFRPIGPALPLRNFDIFLAFIACEGNQPLVKIRTGK